MIARSLETKIKNSSKSVLLLGPRQTGKSTLLNQLKPDLILNLSDELTFLQFSKNPNLLNELLAAQKPKTIFIDEIQRIPSLLNTIQVILDNNNFSKNKLKFYISGSSARKLKRGHANLLPGRVFSFETSGLSYSEIQADFDIINAIQFGLLPEPFLLATKNQKSDAKKLLSSYSAIYLKEEILAESLTRNIQGFARFLSQIAKSTGAILDYSKLAKRSHISRTSLVRFFEILEDTLIAHRIFPYLEIENANSIRHPKLYFFDVGVLNGLVEDFDVSDARKGILFEHLIYNLVRNACLSMDIKLETFYFRTRHGVEVDFVFCIQNKKYAVEVKSGPVISDDYKHLKDLMSYDHSFDGYFLVAPNTPNREVEIKNSYEKIIICSPAELLNRILPQ